MFIAGPICSVLIFPAVSVYVIDAPLLSFLVAGGGVAATGFMVYAEMYWLLRNMNELVLEIDDGNYNISFEHERLDNVGQIFNTFEEVAGDLGESISTFFGVMRREFFGAQ